MSESLPLFPLSTVLYPGHDMALRLFERRYIDMMRSCLRNGDGFGIVARFDAEEGEDKSHHASVGTEARVVDFNLLEDGLLGVQCRGFRRFRIQHTTVEHDGLIRGEVEWLPPDAAQAIAPTHAGLQTLMREVLRQAEHAEALDVDTEDASSLGYGLAAILPLNLLQAQQLLEINDPTARLDALIPLIEMASEQAATSGEQNH